MFLCSLFGCNYADGESFSRDATQNIGPGFVRLSIEKVETGNIAVQPAMRRNFSTYRDFHATVVSKPHSTAHIFPLVRGRVVEVFADLGLKVKAGEVLAILYSQDLAEAQTAYLKALAQLYVAEHSYARAEMLGKEKAIPPSETQRRRGEMLRMRDKKRDSQDRLYLLGMSAEKVHQLDDEHTIQPYVQVTAPFDSRVVATNIIKGEVVEITHTMFTVADLSTVWVSADVPEKNLPLIRPICEASRMEQKVEVLLTAYPGEVFHGDVTYLDDFFGDDTPAMSLHLEVPNSERKVKPNMYATVRVHSLPEQNVLVLPESAIQRERDRQFVFVRHNTTTFQARDVQVGESNGREVRILDGIRDGESVVVSGTFILTSELWRTEI